jgi:hypothetical protein
MILRTLTTLTVLTVSMLPWSVAAAGDDGTPPGNPSAAVFEQHTIDLATSWEDATACIELGDQTECFRTEEEMLETYGALLMDGGQNAAARGGIVPMAVCSTSLRLYRSTSYTGGTLVLTTRGVVLNLSTYGFDNDTSSYRVGACSSVFWAGASGSGSVYPGPTNANAVAPQMMAGWNNTVSSVYIN